MPSPFPSIRTAAGVFPGCFLRKKGAPQGAKSAMLF